MGKKDPTVSVAKPFHEAHEQVPAKDLREALGLIDSNLLQLRLDEISKLLWVPEDANEGTRLARLVRALELYESQEPADGAEGMLAMQMVGTHDAALECLRRAASSKQTFAGRDMALKHAHKLMTLYTQQLARVTMRRSIITETVHTERSGEVLRLSV